MSRTRVLSCQSLRTVGRDETFVIMRTIAVANDDTELGSLGALSRFRSVSSLTVIRTPETYRRCYAGNATANTRHDSLMTQHLTIAETAE